MFRGCTNNNTFSICKVRKKLNHSEVNAIKGLSYERNSTASWRLTFSRVRNECCKHEYTQTHAHPRPKATLTWDVWTLRSKSSTTTSFIAPLDESPACGGHSYSCVNCADHFTEAGQQPAALTESTFREEVGTHCAVTQRVELNCTSSP